MSASFTSPTGRLATRLTLKASAFIMACWLGVMWLLEAVDTVIGHALDRFGIEPRNLAELPAIYVAPLLHLTWAHLISNSVPFFVLGVIILLSGLKHWLVSSFASVTTSGLSVWLLAPEHSVTIGASGWVFGWLTYLLARGLFSKDVRQILLAVVVFAVYGGILWGVLPSHTGVSWQGHLGGAVGGILAAWWLHSRSERRSRA